MGNKKNIMDTIHDTALVINPHYCVSWKEAQEIVAAGGGGPLESFYNGFCLGYLQGTKAAKAEAVKGGATA